jgi:hypothetical protein
VLTEENRGLRTTVAEHENYIQILKQALREFCAQNEGLKLKVEE